MLTALELTGFKSFADRTRLDFPAGVTAVVGPNGSGKSNVVDGIKWVLGSQSPKALRGSEMTDVIFNGSTSRRPLNTAEVTLEFDNSGGLFPAGGPIADGESTVRLTRRVYRSGDSEYLINGATVRLRDLRELLAGTGMGGTGGGSYGIIEQGRVDAVLQSSPNERRNLFEEAAGISRFRLKKQEATRRLARVEQNLLRLSDIVDEVEGRLRRVRAQAGKARRHREQAERLTQLRTELGLADWRTLTESLHAAERDGSDAAAEQQQAQADLQECEAALESHVRQTESDATELMDLDARLSDVRAAVAAREARVAEASAALHRAESDLIATREKLVAAQSRPRAEREPLATAAATEAADAERAVAETKRVLTVAQRALARVAAAREALQQRQRRLADTLQDNHRQTVKAEEKIAALGAARTDARARVEQARSVAERAAEQLKAAEARRAETAGEVEVCSRSVEAAAEQLTAARDTLQRTREELATKQRGLAHAQAELVGVDHRHAAVEQLEQKLEKLASDIQGVLTDDGSGDTPVVHGMVADLLQVDYDTAPMIEAALAGRAQHLVVDSADRLVDALADGQAELRVRASFQRLDASTPTTALDRIDLSGEPGVMGRADQFVDTDPAYEPLVQRLLSKTWFVDSLATAARLSTGPGRGLSFVTFHGETLSADGGIFVGPTDTDAGLITSRRRATQLHEERDAAQARVDTLVAEVDELEKMLGRVTDEEQSLFAEHTEEAERLAAAKQQQAGLDERVAQFDREARQAADSLQKAQQKLGEIDQAATAAADRLAAAKSAELASEGASASAARQLTLADAWLADANTQVGEAQIALATAEHAAKTLAATVEAEHRDASEQVDLRNELERQCRLAGEQAEGNRQVLLVSRAELAGLYLERDALVASRKAAATQRQSDNELRRRGSEQLQKLRDRVATLTHRVQQSELSASQHRQSRRALEQRMREDHGIDLAAAAAAAGPSSTAVSDAERGDLQRELDRLRVEVQSIGPVNVDALDEVDELEQRFERLSEQYRDLSSAKGALERLTGRINRDSRELFLATMETVRGHFRELFRRLFGGGEADVVVLQDGDDDVLECGVEIVAQPPGKELSSISLLSGGEKTMTCVALLLALFRTKPSPFCVLDEVDAALDEANIGRFTAVLTEFLSATQFLVVTHSKKTMLGADTIYGVTMQEPGVSLRVGVRLEDVGEDGQFRVGSATDNRRLAA
ncbi:MAG: chromosome segregation protein SMC [Planctomycetota bacterium]